MPFLTGLALDSIAAQEALSSMNPEVMARFQASGRPRPAATASAYLIAEIADSRLASEIPPTPRTTWESLIYIGAHPHNAQKVL